MRRFHTDGRRESTCRKISMRKPAASKRLQIAAWSPVRSFAGSISSEVGAALGHGRAVFGLRPARAGEGRTKHVESVFGGHAPAHESEQERGLAHRLAVHLV